MGKMRAKADSKGGESSKTFKKIASEERKRRLEAFVAKLSSDNYTAEDFRNDFKREFGVELGEVAAEIMDMLKEVMKKGRDKR